MISNNYFTDDEDLVLFFNQLIEWNEVVKATEGENFEDHKVYLETKNPRYEMAPTNTEEAVELYRSTLESLGEFFGKEISQISAYLDKTGLKYENGKVIFPNELVQIYERFKSTGLMAYSMPREAGGLGLPVTMAAFYSMIMGRGDVSFCMAMNLLNLAQIVTRYGTKEQIEKYAVPAAQGDTLFAMSLTEPDFGSDLNNVRTVAIKQKDGSYKLTGTKRFISQGCGLGHYSSLMLTLARTGKQGGGARGLSVFLVKSTDSNIAGIEKKMGIHTSPTCEVVYENTHGELLGEEGQGLTRCTLGMTNFMRLSSAAGGAAGGAGSYFESLKYAKERIQFGKPIIEIPAVSAMLDKLKRETNAMRLLSFETAFAVDMIQHRQIRLEKSGVSDREIRRNEIIKNWSNIASLLTPIAKFYCSEQGFECTSVAVQIHGGAGYTEDYDVSRMFRDARINTIYEGTSQIQVRLSVGSIQAGMANEGYLRKYLENIWKGIPNPSVYLKEQKVIFENLVPIYKNIEDEDRRERIAENLVILTARYLCSILYERALEKLKGNSALERWKKDCKDYVWDSTAIIKACEFRICNL